MAEVVEKSGVHLTGADSGWPVAGSSEAQPKKDGTGSDPHSRASEVAGGVFEINERQKLVVDATAGQFKLTYSGQQTADIAFNASAAALTSALEALSNIGVGDVLVSGPTVSGTQRTWYVTFQGATLGESDVAQMTTQAGTTPLSGGAGTATVTTTTPGS